MRSSLPAPGDTAIRSRMRERLAKLRARFGEQDWLIAVSGVMAEAYRLAGLTGAEFGALVREHCSGNGVINIQHRVKPVMRLNRGFDHVRGVIMQEDGLVEMFFHYGRGTYSDPNDILIAHGGFDLEALLASVTGKRRGHLTRSMAGKPVGQLVDGLPRCLAGVSIREIRRTLEHALSIQLAASWETLATMPPEIADELAIERQREPCHLPWLEENVGQEPARL